jgi:lipopolysaccharide/colanic/teichoic acid biosynthesis glycosyltransferase
VTADPAPLNRFPDVQDGLQRPAPRARGGVPDHRHRASGPRSDDVARAAAEVDWQAALPDRARRPQWRRQQRLKRALDIALAGFGLVVLAPFLALVAVAVMFDSPGAVFYPWRVVGYRGRPFTGYKFRTMVPGADRQKAELLHLNEMSGPVFKIRRDPRLTRVGRLLRKFSVDELPELWSVLVGEMSLVGPRPLGEEEFIACSPVHRQKLSVQPGITCLWQVLGRSEIRDFDEWVRLDKQYIWSWSLWLDLKILAKTIVIVLRGTGAY